MLKLVISGAILMLTMSQGVWACCDPATTTSALYFGPGANTGLTCSGTSTDVALGCGGSPNPTPVNHLDVFFNKSSVSDLEQFYLIIGIPVVAGGPNPAAPNITRVDTYNPYTPTKDPLPSSSTTGWAASLCGALTASTAGDAYSVCGLNVTDKSNTFTNWYNAAAGLGLNPVKFVLFQYNISSVEDIGPKGVYDVFFGGNLPVGTMEIAYGCSTNNCPYECYSTPFSQAGQTVPEPSTLLMMAGAGLIFLGRIWRRR